MVMKTSKAMLQGSAAAASLLLSLGTVSAAPDGSAPFGIGTSPVLKHLPAGRDDLLFRGEDARRSFSIVLSTGEAEQAKTFQLGLKNTVALLPDRSSLRIMVNGKPLATVPVRSPNALTIVPVAIPPGALTAGANRIDVEVLMAHRVDCSVAATYELWTALDPEQTGILVSALPDASIGSFEEVAGEAQAADGTARLYLHLPEASDAATLTRASRLVDALVQRAGFSRPVVAVGTSPASGPGIDIELINDRGDGDTKDLHVLGHEDGVTYARNAAGRLTLVLSGSNAADREIGIAAFAKRRSARLHATDEVQIEGETEVAFAELGLPSVDFSGRHFAGALNMALPADFYSADYGKARLLLDGSYATDLLAGSALAVRVNGVLASSLDLGSSRGGVLRGEPVDLPLRLFRPGRNEIAIEGVMLAASDRECLATSGPAKPRLAVSGTSRLTFPAFAHLATTPQISTAWAAATSAVDETNLYLAGSDAVSIGSGLTALANLAAEGTQPLKPVVHVGMPAASDIPGLVVAPWPALPAFLSTQLEARVTGGSPSERVVRQNIADHRASADLPATPPSLSMTWAANYLPSTLDPQPLVDKTKQLFGGESGLSPRSILGGARHLLQQQGFAFPENDRANTVPFTARTVLAAAVDGDSSEATIAGMPMPGLVDRTTQWMVATASAPDVLQAGLDRMTTDRRWRDMHGDIVALDTDKGEFWSAEPSRISYVRPDRLSVGEIRPILGGLVSNNIELSLAVLALLMSLLGVTTHALVRRTGAK